jgi:methylthioribose-1-phosphate isomerase
MRIDGQPTRTIRPAPGRNAVLVIDQRWLPHRVTIERLGDVAAVHRAIRDMQVRGAPLIGDGRLRRAQARADASDVLVRARCRDPRVRAAHRGEPGLGGAGCRTTC